MQRHVTKQLFTFAKMTCLLLDAPPEHDHPAKNHQRHDQRQCQQKNRMRRRPPRGALQHGDVRRRTKKNPEGFCDSNPFLNVALRIDLDRTDSRDAHPAPDLPCARLGSCQDLGQNRRNHSIAGGEQEGYVGRSHIMADQ